MGLINWLQRALSSDVPGFTEFEKAVLARVADSLPPELCPRLHRRIDEVDGVQRLDGGREVVCQMIRHGKPVLDEGTRINGDKGETLLAKVIVDGAPGSRNVCQVWLVDGHLSRLKFAMPTDHADIACVTLIDVVGDYQDTRPSIAAGRPRDPAETSV